MLVFLCVFFEALVWFTSSKLVGFCFVLRDTSWSFVFGGYLLHGITVSIMSSYIVLAVDGLISCLEWSR